jgi:DNA-3-methyladenine glycosylase II
MARLARRVRPTPLRARRLPPFVSLARAILYQQLNGTAAGSIEKRLVATVGRGRFPGPAALRSASLARLRAAGLSRQKIRYLRELAREALGGRLPALAWCDRAGDEEVLERLTGFLGVGRWTAEMFLMFNLGREDVLPAHDFGVRTGFRVAYGKRGLPAPRALARFGRRWAPYRSFAARCLWRAAEGAREVEKPAAGKAEPGAIPRARGTARSGDGQRRRSRRNETTATKSRVLRKAKR